MRKNRKQQNKKNRWNKTRTVKVNRLFSWTHIKTELLVGSRGLVHQNWTAAWQRLGSCRFPSKCPIGITFVCRERWSASLLRRVVKRRLAFSVVCFRQHILWLFISTEVRKSSHQAWAGAEITRSKTEDCTDWSKGDAALPSRAIDEFTTRWDAARRLAAQLQSRDVDTGQVYILLNALLPSN